MKRVNNDIVRATVPHPERISPMCRFNGYFIWILQDIFLANRIAWVTIGPGEETPASLRKSIASVVVSINRLFHESTARGDETAERQGQGISSSSTSPSGFRILPTQRISILTHLSTRD